MYLVTPLYKGPRLAYTG